MIVARVVSLLKFGGFSSLTNILSVENSLLTALGPQCRPVVIVGRQNDSWHWRPTMLADAVCRGLKYQVTPQVHWNRTTPSCKSRIYIQTRKSPIAHLDTHHLVSGINSEIHSVSLASHVSTYFLIHLSAHLCHHHHSHHPSLLHSFTPGSKPTFSTKSFPP